ncbi:ABC transporter permease [Embleya sp. NPDC005575]|uniref:ABC transporter permease n=1 Tax=Embleya sp. NPDC005575 TaxID=3156892 RepID=UPI0033AC953D
MRTLMRLEILRMLRNRRYLIFTLAYPVAMYLIFGSQSGDVDGTDVAAYIMVSMASFGAVGATLSAGVQRIAAERQSGWTRQLRLTTLTGRQYVISKLASAAVVSLPAIVLVLFTGFLRGVRLDPWQWGVLVIALWFGSFVFAVLGIGLGYLVAPDSAQPVFMLVYLGMAVLGGMWVPLTGFPQLLQDIGHVMPTYRFGELGWEVLAGRHPRMSDIAILALYLVAFTALAAWRYRRDEQKVAA